MGDIVLPPGKERCLVGQLSIEKAEKEEFLRRLGVDDLIISKLGRNNAE
jgi:hypothetical protein